MTSRTVEDMELMLDQARDALRDAIAVVRGGRIVQVGEYDLYEPQRVRVLIVERWEAALKAQTCQWCRYWRKEEMSELVGLCRYGEGWHYDTDYNWTCARWEGRKQR